MVKEFLLEWYFKVIDTWITKFHTRYRYVAFIFYIFWEFVNRILIEVIVQSYQNFGNGVSLLFRVLVYY